MDPDIKLTGDSTIELYGGVRVTDESDEAIFQSTPSPRIRIPAGQPDHPDGDITIGDARIDLPLPNLVVSTPSFAVGDDGEDLFSVTFTTDTEQASDIAPEYYDELVAINANNAPTKVFVSDLRIGDRPNSGPSESYPIFRVTRMEDTDHPDDYAEFQRVGLRMWKYGEFSPPNVHLGSDHTLLLGHEHAEWGGSDALLTQHGQLLLYDYEGHETVVLNGEGEPTVRVGDPTAGGESGTIELLGETTPQIRISAEAGGEITVGAKARGQASTSKHNWGGVGLFADGTISAVYETDTVSTLVAQFPAGNGLRYSTGGLGLVTKSANAPDELLDWSVGLYDGYDDDQGTVNGGAVVVTDTDGTDRVRLDATRNVEANVALYDDDGAQTVGISDTGAIVVGSEDIAGALVVEDQNGDLIFEVDETGTVTVSDTLAITVAGNVN